jgi:hypothetical protein
MTDDELGLPGNAALTEGTGDADEPARFRTIVCDVGRYRIYVRVTADNRFAGVESIETKADFVRNRTRAMLPGYHDVSRFYLDE